MNSLVGVGVVLLILALKLAVSALGRSDETWSEYHARLKQAPLGGPRPLWRDAVESVPLAAVLVVALIARTGSCGSKTFWSCAWPYLIDGSPGWAHPLRLPSTGACPGGDSGDELREISA